ncbi:MAG: histidine phosphatase family protein [Candidatus ainarchaeum sp.]|nr:histidine phosphatase family protein [Candidatus ainarchaeum sp.]
MKIILINSPNFRDSNLKKYSIGDESLSNEGMIRAHELGVELKKKNLSKLFTSSFQSALETGLIIKKLIPLELHSVSDFRGRNDFGVFLGLSHKEAREKFLDEVEDYESNKPYHNVSGSENYFDFAKRVTDSFNSIIKNEFENKTNCIGFILHACVIEVIFRELIGFEVGEVEECALIEFDFDGEGFELISSKGVIGIESTLA